MFPGDLERFGLASVLHWQMHLRVLFTVYGMLTLSQCFTCKMIVSERSMFQRETQSKCITMKPFTVELPKGQDADTRENPRVSEKTRI